MAGQRIRIGRLENAGQVAMENAKAYRELRRGKLDAALASRLSQILINQRIIFSRASMLRSGLSS
jgi:hypothetical protein